MASFINNYFKFFALPFAALLILSEEVYLRGYLRQWFEIMYFREHMSYAGLSIEYYAAPVDGNNLIWCPTRSFDSVEGYRERVEECKRKNGIDSDYDEEPYLEI